MKLNYKAVSKDGKIFKGVIEAKDVNEAGAYLRSKELLPTLLSAQKENKLLKYIALLNKTSAADVVFFTRQLSSMLMSGLTLMDSLRILKEQVQKEKMMEILAGIITEVEEGKPFSGAVAKYPDVFSSIYISLVEAGEKSGLLDKVLLRLADNLEKQQKLKGSIKSALMYPMIVVIGMIGVMIIMMVVVIPQLNVLYQNLNIPLPLPTRIVVGLSNFMITFWPLIIAVIVFGISFYKRWTSTIGGRIIKDDFFLRLPIFGKLIQQSILTEFTRTFGLLVGSGTLIIDALSEVKAITGNIIFENAIEDISEKVEKGVTIGDAMSAYTLFPPILVEMVKIGEQTGKIDESLLRVSEYFEREVEQTVKTLTTALEPIIMVILGLGVAFLIISIITPIYNLTSSIQ